MQHRRIYIIVDINIMYIYIDIHYFYHIYYNKQYFQYILIYDLIKLLSDKTSFSFGKCTADPCSTLTVSLVYMEVLPLLLRYILHVYIWTLCSEHLSFFILYVGIPGSVHLSFFHHVYWDTLQCTLIIFSSCILGHPVVYIYPFFIMYIGTPCSVH